MKLYEVNQAIADIFEQMVDPETGEILCESDALMAQLDALQMERKSILGYMAKLVLNYRSDLVLFCNYQTYVVTAENKSQKAQGGKRVMYTSHHPCWDAKNRHNLPDMLDLDFSGIAHIFAAAEAPEFSTMKKLKLQMLDAHITSDSLLQFIKGKGHCAEAACLEDIPESFLTGWVLKYWPNIVSNITAGTAQQTK